MSRLRIWSCVEDEEYVGTRPIKLFGGRWNPALWGRVRYALTFWSAVDLLAVLPTIVLAPICGGFHSCRFGPSSTTAEQARPVANSGGNPFARALSALRRFSAVSFESPSFVGWRRLRAILDYL